MKNLNKIFTPLIFIIYILISGCATPMSVSMDTHEQPYTADTSNEKDKGYVYFYREKEFMASLRGIYVTADGNRIGALNNGTYFVYEAPIGKNVFSVEDWLEKDDPTRTIDVEAGKKYYLKGSLKMGFWDAVPYINIINESEGSQAIKGLKYETMKEKNLTKQ